MPLLVALAFAAEVVEPAEAVNRGAAPDPVSGVVADGWTVHGEARLRAEVAAPFAVDAEGVRSGRGWWLRTRGIVGLSRRTSDVARVDIELELLNGWLAGQATTLGQVGGGADVFRPSRAEPRDLVRILPRKLSATFDTAIGRVAVGAQTFGWGAGLLANDGAGDPDFGDAWQGNVVGRLGFATAPWSKTAAASDFAKKTAFFVASDLVIRDDNSSLYDGDATLQGVLGWRTETDPLAVGALAVVRYQRDRLDPARPVPDPSTSLVFPVDAWIRARTPANRRHQLGVEAEGVWVSGRTDRALNEATVARGASVAGVAALARIRYDHRDARVTAKVEAGFASGDDDPRDDVQRAFSMHSDHNVGLVLFEEVLPMVAARTVDRLADPALVGVPTPGLRFAVPQGGVTNALYVAPVVRWRPPGTPLDLRLGYVWARSAGTYADLYQSVLAGGYPTDLGGAPAVTGASYGHEVDAAVRLDGAAGPVRLRGGLEGGVLAPGAAFRGLDLSAVWTARARLDVAF